MMKRITGRRAREGCSNLGSLGTDEEAATEMGDWYIQGGWLSKYVKDDRSEVSHCWKREVQIWKEKYRMKPVWCCIQLKGLV